MASPERRIHRRRYIEATTVESCAPAPWQYRGVNTRRAGRMADLALHPTVKPVSLIADALRDVSGRGEIVLDGFGGSGSTLIAAGQDRPEFGPSKRLGWSIRQQEAANVAHRQRKSSPGCLSRGTCSVVRWAPASRSRSRHRTNVPRYRPAGREPASDTASRSRASP